MLGIVHKHFIPDMLIGTISLYHFISLSIDGGLGLQDQQKAEPDGIIFLNISQLISMKFDTVLNQFRLNIQMLLYTDFWTKVMTAAVYTRKKNNSVA